MRKSRPERSRGRDSHGLWDLTLGSVCPVAELNATYTDSEIL